MNNRPTDDEKSPGITVPRVYRVFLEEHAEMFDGGLLCFENGVLYDVETIAERYKTLEFDKYAPEYIPIGNDNGEYALVMRSGINVTRFGVLEHGSIGAMRPEHLQNFKKWYEAGHSFSFDDEEDDDILFADKVKVVLKKTPDNRARTMMVIRKALMLEAPVSELLSFADKAPCVLTDKFSGVVARRIIEENGLGEWLEIKL